MIEAVDLNFERELLNGVPARADSDTATASATHEGYTGAGTVHVEFMDPNPVLELVERRKIGHLAGE